MELPAPALRLVDPPQPASDDLQAPGSGDSRDPAGPPPGEGEERRDMWIVDDLVRVPPHGTATLQPVEMPVDAVRSRSWQAAGDDGQARRDYDAKHEKARQMILAGVFAGRSCTGKRKR